MEVVHLQIRYSYPSANTDTASLLRRRSVGMAEEGAGMGGTVSVAQQRQGPLQNGPSPSTLSSSSSKAGLDVDMDSTQYGSSGYSISSQSAEFFAESFAKQQSTKLMMRSSVLMEAITTKAERQSQFVKISTIEEMDLIGPQFSPPPSSFPSPIIQPGLDMDTNLAKGEPLSLSATSEYTKLSATLTNLPPLPGQIKKIKKATNDFMPNSPSDLCKPSYRAYKSMCEVFEEKAEMLKAGNVRGFICCLDFSLETFPLLRELIMKALKNVGKAFDESKKSESVQSNEIFMEKTILVTTSKSSDHRNTNAEMERALLPFAPMASDYIRTKSISRGGTSSLHTYEDWHIHKPSRCKIKHEEEIYPHGFNPKLISIFKKCSKQRLRRERHERYKLWREQARKRSSHIHRNPFLSEYFIKECGGESYGDLEGKIDIHDMRDAAYWEITSRRVGDFYSRRKSTNFGFRKNPSPLRRELRRLEDHLIPEEVMPNLMIRNGKMGVESQGVRERKRKLDRDIDIDWEEVEDEQRTYKARMEARRLEICEKEVRVNSLAMQKMRDKEKERESRRKERRERKNREKDRERWENRERSHCCVTQAWIDMGVEMGRVGGWE